MKVLFYAFVTIMVLEAFAHSTKREGMLTAEDIFSKLDEIVEYEDEDEY